MLVHSWFSTHHSTTHSDANPYNHTFTTTPPLEQLHVRSIGENLEEPIDDYGSTLTDPSKRFSLSVGDVRARRHRDTEEEAHVSRLTSHVSPPAPCR